jgi:putative ubiquitin-RnfH superfamily antitoxin RatB of RatAB toxin-antitoxin module
MAERRTVRVIYALPDLQVAVDVPLEAGLTAQEAVARSRLPERYPEIDERPLVLGLFGQRIELERVVAPGDRIEICRPLVRDPRDLRRILLSQGRVVGDVPD